MKRLIQILLTLTLIATVFWGAVASGITQTPHENPATAESHFNIALPLLHYSEIFEQVAKGKYPEARTLIQQLKLDYAHLPEGIIFIMRRYNDLTSELTERLDSLDSMLDACEQLLSENRLDEASLKLSEASGLVGKAGELIENISMATEELVLQVAPIVSPQEAEAVNDVQARLQRAIERLKELEAQYRGKLDSLETEARGKEYLSTTELTLNINPAQVWVGDQVTISGTLKAEDSTLPAREVRISLRGKHFTAATTVEDGSYKASFALPYWYASEVEAQAFYLPQGDDKLNFTASSSMVKKMAVLFYATKLKIEAPEKAYPGLAAEISGQVSSEGNIAGREIKVLLDGEPLFEAITEEHGLFQHQVVLSRETHAGEHSLSIAVAPEDKSRSAGVLIDKALSVVKVTPEIKVHAPKVIVLPQKVELTGEVHSPLPLQGATATLEMAGVSATSIVDEGKFKLGLDLPFKFNVMGFEEMKLSLAPSEAWQLPTTYKVNIFVLNSLYLAIVLAALILAAVVSLRRKTKIVQKEGGATTAQEKSQTSVSAIEFRLPEIKPGAGDNKGIILKAYYTAAAGVQRLTRVLLKPQMTLREFLCQVKPPLGMLAGLFAKLTSLAERALYSPHAPRKNEASLAQNLASQVKEKEDEELKP